MAPATPASYLASAPPDLLRAALEISLTAVHVLRPLHGPSGELADFALDYLNPAGQRMTGLPEQPGLRALTRFPEIGPSGVFDFYRRAFESGEAGQFRVNYQADGLDNFYYFAAQRCGELLVVSFTDTADQPRTAVEEALREAQAAGRTARAEAEAQRQRFYEVLMQLPAQVATYHGPEHVYNFVNAAYQRYFPAQQPLPGRPLREVLPETEAQGVLAVMDRVYQTGEPSYQPELEVWLDHTGRGQHPQQLFLNLYFHPLRDAQGRVDGLLDFSYDVTEQVRARRQVEQLNQELEARVLERTREVQAARAEVEAQRQLLQSVLTQAPVAIGVFQGEDLVVTQANDLLCAMWGYEPAQVLGKPLLEGVPELRGQGFGELLREVGRTHVPFAGSEMPAALRQADGGLETHYFNFVYQPLYGPAGELLGVLDIATDVTKQVEAHQQAAALQAEVLAAAQRQVAERETFYQVFAQTPALVALLRTPSHRFEFVNPAYQALFPGRPLVGLDLAVAIPEMPAQGFVALLDHVYQTGETFFGADVPFAAAPAEGPPARPAYYNFTYQAYRENGEVAGISIFAFDVSEQVRARQEREARQGQLRELFAQAPVAIAVFEGPDYVIEVANPSVATLWGRTPEQVVGQPLFEALPEIDPAFRPLLDHVVRTGGTYAAQEVSTPLLRQGQVETVYLNFVYQPLREADGTITRVAAVATDVTAQVRAREQLERLNEELTATNEELHQSNTQLTRTNVDLDNFIYTASHDLKAPITNIEGLLDTLRHELPEQEPTSEVSFILGLMHDAVHRFQRTIEHLTAVSKLQKEHAPRTEQVALAPVIDDVRLDLAPLVKQTGGHLQVDVQQCPPLLFSEKNLRSVVYNLLSNAFKYHHPDRPPLVQVRTRLEEAFVVLEVQDNGLGLDLSRERQLFALFQRLHTHVEGTGIGLYMVKRMVENAGGKITVHSQLGEGTTFAVYFPR